MYETSRRRPAALLLALASLSLSPTPLQDEAAPGRAEFESDLDLVRLDLLPTEGEFPDRIYTRAFSRLGIDIDGQSSEEVLSRLRSLGLGQRAGLVLDAWARACVVRGSDHYERSNRRIALAIDADPDEVRATVRRAFLEKGLLEVHELAAKIAGGELSPCTALYVAETLNYAGDLGGCTATLLATIQRHPDDFDLRLAAGHHLGRAKRTAEACAQLEAARALAPESLWPLVARAHAERYAGEFEAAEATCREVLASDPDFHAAHRVLCHVGQLAPDDALTAASYREMLRIEPADPISHNNLAWLLATAADETLRAPKEALAHAEIAIGLSPENGDNVNTLGVCLYRAGEFDRCIETLERSAEMTFAGKVSDYLFLSLAWHALGEDEIARQCYDKGVQRMEKSAATAENLRFQVEAREALGIEG